MRSESVDVLHVAHAPNLDAPAAPVKQGQEYVAAAANITRYGTMTGTLAETGIP